ncbi:MAG: hypothetical protein R3B48_09135 [Kofleriaceae bacterium]
MRCASSLRRACAMAALALAGWAAGGCERPAPEFTGVGPWSVVKTKRKDATGICQPTELPDGRAGTWCFRQPPFGIAKKAAEVDLYFLGAEPEAPLIELQLKIRGCVEGEVEAWLRQHFGAPYEHRGTRAFWRTSRLFLAAFLPQEPGRCILRMLPLSEGAEIERIKLL